MILTQRLEESQGRSARDGCQRGIRGRCARRLAQKRWEAKRQRCSPRHGRGRSAQCRRGRRDEAFAGSSGVQGHVEIEIAIGEEWARRHSSGDLRGYKKQDDDLPTDPQELMRQMMGFSGFGTTQGKTADANKGSASAKGFVRRGTSTRQYRQYMNRAGGFNRPLDAPKKTL